MAASNPFTDPHLDPNFVSKVRSKCSLFTDLVLPVVELAAILRMPVLKLRSLVGGCSIHPGCVRDPETGLIEHLNEDAFLFIFSNLPRALGEAGRAAFITLKMEEARQIFFEGAWRSPYETPEFKAFKDAEWAAFAAGGEQQIKGFEEAVRLREIAESTPEALADNLLYAGSVYQPVFERGPVIENPKAAPDPAIELAKLQAKKAEATKKARQASNRRSYEKRKADKE